MGSTVEVLVDEPGVGRSHREAPEIDGVVDLPAGLPRRVRFVDRDGHRRRRRRPRSLLGRVGAHVDVLVRAVGPGHAGQRHHHGPDGGPAGGRLLIVGTDTQWPALALWFVLAVSDLADGWLARRQGATRSGAFLDPLADKVLVLGAMTALVAKGALWWVPVALIATREVAVSAYRSYVGRRGISVPARMSGKVKTWVQAIAVGLAIAPIDVRGLPRPSSTGWCGLAVAMTLVTGVQYLHDGRQVVRAL